MFVIRTEAGGPGDRARLDQSSKLGQLPQKVGPRLRGQVPGKHIIIQQIPVRTQSDPGAAAAPNLEKSLAHQQLHGLADNRLADPKALPQTSLIIDQLAFPMDPADDPPAQLPADMGSEARWRAAGILEIVIEKLRHIIIDNI